MPSSHSHSLAWGRGVTSADERPATSGALARLRGRSRGVAFPRFASSAIQGNEEAWILPDREPLLLAVAALRPAAVRVPVAPARLTAEEIARRAMKVAGDICVYTNHSIRLEKLENKAGAAK